MRTVRVMTTSFEGMSGLMSVTGEPEGQPQKVGVAVTDVFTGIYAATAILAAVHQRTVTGEGQHLDLALLDVATSVMANQAMNYLATGVSPKRMGNAHPNLVPYAVFPCSDGFVILATGNDSQYQKLCKTLKLQEIAEIDDYRTNADRIRNREALTAVISEATRGWTRDALLSACEAVGVPAGPINEMADVFADPQVVARGMQIAPGGVPGVRLPVVFSGAELALDRPSPRLGEHDAEIRAALAK